MFLVKGFMVIKEAWKFVEQRLHTVFMPIKTASPKNHFIFLIKLSITFG